MTILTVKIWENFHPGYRDLGRKYRRNSLENILPHFSALTLFNFCLIMSQETEVLFLKHCFPLKETSNEPTSGIWFYFQQPSKGPVK